MGAGEHAEMSSFLPSLKEEGSRGLRPRLCDKSHDRAVIEYVRQGIEPSGLAFAKYFQEHIISLVLWEALRCKDE